MNLRGNLREMNFIFEVVTYTTFLVITLKLIFYVEKCNKKMTTSQWQSFSKLQSLTWPSQKI